MKISCDDERELSTLEKLSDEELVGHVRDAMKRARDSLPGNVGSSKEIERSDHTADDPPRTPGTPAPPQRNGAAAMDAAIPGYSRIGPNRDGRTRVVDEDLIVQSPKRAW